MENRKELEDTKYFDEYLKRLKNKNKEIDKSNTESEKEYNKEKNKYEKQVESFYNNCPDGFFARMSYMKNVPKSFGSYYGYYPARQAKYTLSIDGYYERLLHYKM